MENIYFKGLEKALNDGCFIIALYSSTSRSPVVRVEKKNEEAKRISLISYPAN